MDPDRSVKTALNEQFARLGRALAELPPDGEVVAYCRPPFCLSAPAAVAALRAMGFRPRRLVDGFPEWRAAGLPMTIGTDA